MCIYGVYIDREAEEKKEDAEEEKEERYTVHSGDDIRTSLFWLVLPYETYNTVRAVLTAGTGTRIYIPCRDTHADSW